MASETTIYDVVTRYTEEHRSVGADPAQRATRAQRAYELSERAAQRYSASLSGVERTTSRAERALARGEVTVRNFGSSLATAARFSGPLVGVGAGLLGIGAAGAIAQRVFSGLNEEAEKSLQLASSFNLAFSFDADPARQFAASMRESRKMVAGIVEDAARLPGSSRDFFGIASITAGPIFRAGGSPEDVRRMLGNIALAAPFVGQTAGDAGGGAMRILTGQAGADIPLYQNLASAGMLPKAETFNAQKAEERFRQLDRALEKLVGNEFFRKEVDSLMATQLGTLDDLLFGPKGIGGTVARGLFEAFGTELASFNRSLQENAPAIVGALRTLGYGISAPFSWADDLLKYVGAKPLGQTFAEAGYTVQGSNAGDDILKAAGMHENEPMRRYYQDQLLGPGRNTGNTGESLLRRYAESLYAGAAQPGSGYDAELVNRAMRTAALEISQAREAQPMGPVYPMPQKLLGVMQGSFQRELELSVKPFAGERRGTDGAVFSSNVTHNHFGPIRIDLKSDDSPEGIAVKLQKAVEIATRRPTRSSRAMPIGPGTSAAR